MLPQGKEQLQKRWLARFPALTEHAATTRGRGARHLALDVLQRFRKAGHSLPGVPGFEVVPERLKTLLLIGCSALVVILVCACLTNGSPFKMYHAYVTSYQDTLSMQGGQGFGWKRFRNVPSISMQEGMVFTLGALGLILAAFCMKRKDSSILMTFFVCLLCSFFVLFPKSAGALLRSYHFPIVNIIGISVLVLLAWTFLKRDEDYSLAPGELALALMFFVLPAMYAFGTNLDYWMTGSKVIVFPVIGAVMMFRLLPAEMFKNIVPPFVMGMLLLVTLSITHAQQVPYRQDAPIHAQDAEVRIGGGTLFLSKGYASSIDEVRMKAQQGGFTPGTPVVDLTGRSPGVLYALDAEAVGAPWVIGGYRGSLNLATRVLQRVPQDKLKRSWILVEPRGKRSIPDKIFARLNLDFPSGYEKRAEWTPVKNMTFCLYAPKNAPKKPQKSEPNLEQP